MQEALQAEKSRLQGVLAQEERAASAAAAQHPAPETAQTQSSSEKEDELDAFMGQVAVQLEQDKVCHDSFSRITNVAGYMAPAQVPLDWTTNRLLIKKLIAGLCQHSVCTSKAVCLNHACPSKHHSNRA